LVGSGVLGLMEAIKRYDLSMELRFATYCVHWVHQRISQYIYKERGLPEGYQTRTRLLERIGGGEMVYHYMSNPNWECQMIDPLYVSAEDMMLRMEEIEKMRHYLSILTERERDILLRHRLGQGEEVLEDIGKSYGITRERIRQIEKKALERLKLYMTKGSIVSRYRGKCKKMKNEEG
jgi:RNA polymerase primary sigma factor